MNEERSFNPVWLIGLSTLIVLGVLAVIFWDFVTMNVILPIYSFAILAVYGINSVSQGVYLFLLILGAGAAAIVFLSITFSKTQPPKYYSSTQYGIDTVSRYDYWLTQCHNLAHTKFANEEFARTARNMLLDVLAFQEHRDPFEMEMMIMREELELPPEIQYLIAHRKLSTKFQQKNWFQRQWRKIQRMINPNALAPIPELKCEAESIITFLEQRLEIIRNE